LTIQESPNLHNSQSFATHPLYVTKQKDTEVRRIATPAATQTNIAVQPACANPYNNLDVRNPLINFDEFFDGESLVQEDLVIWANIAMHHVPTVSTECVHLAPRKILKPLILCA
jgi:primary-amine oxidase